MDFKQLRYFVGVVEAGSFTRAAERLHIAQSALSLHVRQLEEGFGTRLLVRARTGVTPTAAGTKLLEHARTILRQVASANEDLKNTVKSPAGEVTIGIPSGAAKVLVSELLDRARELLPKVSLKIVEGMSGRIEESMAAGQFNLAIVYQAADTTGEVLAREEFCLVAPPNLPPFEETIKLSEVYPFPLAVPMQSNNVRRSVADVAARHGCRLDVRFEVDSLSSIIEMVAQGRAYSILTPASIQREVSRGQVRTIRIVDPVIVRSVVLAVNPRDENSIEVVAVSDLIAKVVKQLAREDKWPATLPA